MKHFFWMLSALLLSGLPAYAGEPALNQPPAGFVALFNGTDLSGWWGASTEDPAKYLALPPEELAKKKQASLADIQKHWSVDKGELVNDGQGLYVTTDKNYGDFEMWVDYKTVAKADSGIYLRGIPQVQIWDYTKDGGKWNIGADKGSGGLWNNAPGAPGKDPLVLADKPFGEWNHVRIVMVGERVTVFLNDKLVVDHARLENYFARANPVPRTGPIQLQTHGGEIRWRNAFIHEIPPEEANQILRNGGPDKKPADDGFVSVFNGKDFTGWAGPVDNYEVVDGAIRCKPGKGGTIYTTEVFKDFVAQLEIRLPPAGNNGLAIRYPGQGDTAYTGMCELQVLDSEHPQYAKLDPRQYHGSVYGIVAAARGYLRETGQWNFQQVTVKGSTIRVELNGTRIVDADVSKVTQFMGNAAHPGKDRTEGHFGFAGHNDPVAFRDVRIKKL
ncbi:MAG: DUF1080 domain-containing protein [Planctomycetota bacterium]|nr:DUF1080 domain-containing protein [Planctomycetota bacterium]